MKRTQPQEPTDVLFVDCHPQNLYGAQRTLLELATGATRRPAALVVAPGALVEALDERGIPVDVLEYPPVLRENGRSLMGGSVLVRLNTAVALLRYNRRAAQVIRRRRAQVVYCSNTRAVLSAGLGARLLRRPVIWYVQQLEESFGLADRIAARIATRVVSISPQSDRVLPLRTRQRLGSRYTAIPLGTPIPATVDGPGRQPDQEERRPAVFAIISVVTPRKGHGTLLPAFAELLGGSPGRGDVRLRILGTPNSPADEAFQSELLAAAAQLGIADEISWDGWVGDVAGSLAEIDVIVSASEVEGLSRVIMEAMAHAVPVIATDVGATSDLVLDGHNGYLVPVGDAGALTAAMARLADDPQLRRRMGAAGYERVREHFDQADFVRAFAEEFTRAADR